MEFKAISILQPWASLVVMGAKQIETRSWNTKYRGTLLIHASKGQKQGLDFCLRNEASIQSLLTFKSLPFGAIIGCVDVIDTFMFSEDPSRQLGEYGAEENPWIPYREGGNDFESLEEQEEWDSNIEKEMAFGDYSPGRYGWLLSDPVMFETPIPCKGSLGLWTPDEMIAKQVDQALAAKQRL